MSGFEIAGVVLGAIPVVLAALDECKKRKVYRVIKSFGYLVDELKTELLQQRFLIESNLDLHLREVGVDGVNISEKSFSQLLKDDPGLVDDLRDNLGQGYGPYESALQRCGELLLDLARSMKGLAVREKIQPTESLAELINSVQKSPNGGYAFKSKIKFILTATDIQERLDRLNTARKMLDDIGKRSTELQNEPIKSSSRSIKTFAAFLRQVRTHASTLYSAIGKSWLDTCHTVHRTHFFLESRPDLLVIKRRKPPVTFDLGFEASHDDVSTLVIHAVSVELLHEEYLSSSSTNKAPVVLFDIQEPNAGANPPIVAIDDMCSSLKHARAGSHSQKLYLHEHRLVRQVQPAPDGHKTSHTSQSQHWVSLEDILREQNLPWKLIPRTQFAFKLASSLLQLHSTPWLPASWAKERICFPRTASGTTLFDRPFVHVDFCQDCHHPPPPPALDQTPSRLDARKPLLELGITLLEVWYYRSLESYIADNDIQGDEYEMPRVRAARQWLAGGKDDIMPTYWEAVERCVECCLTTADSSFPDWQDNVFQESVCDGIIRPLWENCGGAKNMR